LISLLQVAGEKPSNLITQKTRNRVGSPLKQGTGTLGRFYTSLPATDRSHALTARISADRPQMVNKNAKIRKAILTGDDGYKRSP